MKKIILLLLMVVTIPLTCLRAQREVPVDTLKIRALDTTRLWNTIDTFGSLSLSIDTNYHGHIFFMKDTTWCEWRVVLMGDETIVRVDDAGNLYYVPRYFCHCLACRKKTKLEYWGNINGKR